MVVGVGLGCSMAVVVGRSIEGRAVGRVGRAVGRQGSRCSPYFR